MIHSLFKMVLFTIAEIFLQDNSLNVHFFGWRRQLIGIKYSDFLLFYHDFSGNIA